VVKLLLANGADPNKIMKGGETPLAWAKRCKKYKVITILKRVTK
jgi:ankyrin repeat protein